MKLKDLKNVVSSLIENEVIILDAGDVTSQDMKMICHLKSSCDIRSFKLNSEYDNYEVITIFDSSVDIENKDRPYDPKNKPILYIHIANWN